MRAYPLRADPPSPFDRRWRDHMPTQTATTADLSAFLPPVRDQGQEGSCSACSGATARETLARKSGDDTILSASFLYEVERAMGGTLYQDSGARLRQTEAALMQVGVCPESMDPYTPADFVRQITPGMLEAAATYRIKQGYWCPSLSEVLAALSYGVPVQLGVVVYPSFESAPGGEVQLPRPGERPLGGHAICAFGYDAESGRVKVRNSWGESWGDGGNLTLPFEWFSSPATFMSARAYL